MKNKLLLLLAFSLFLSPLLLPYDFGAVKTDAIEELPRVGSLHNLRVLLNQSLKNQPHSYGELRGIFTSTANKQEAAVESSSAMDAGSSVEYSTTNIQEEGVDEADIVKTDGSYIYQVNKKSIVVVDIQNPQKMKVTSKLSIDEYFYPQEMYLGSQYLTVIGFSSMPLYSSNPILFDSIGPNKNLTLPMEKIHREYTNIVTIKVFDITNKDNIKLAREIDLEGNYVSSRIIEGNLYLVANRHINYHGILDKGNDLLPHYKDSLMGEELQKIDPKDIYYFPEAVTPNYVTILGLNLKDIDKEANVSTYLGQGSNIYSSTENLYVSVDRYELEDTTTEPSINQRNTDIYKFALENGKVNYKARGNVPGNILNQFSMDENNGYFRIATTTGEMWRTDELTSKNNVYILDEKMELTGKLEGIAPTERIYSMRFMGDRGYMVTFRETDPFFVLDLKDPKEPKVLGYLKIPGYSDYLHPYDEDHIIGFGKEVVEEYGNALQAGMKVAVFDVKDVTKPVERFKIEIGDRGTDSELLRNHKALLFSREKQLLAFPVSVVESFENDKRGWGQFTFQGAYIYNIDMDKGLELRDRITHLSEEDYLKSGGHWYNSEKNISRILYVGDLLYTVSNSEIRCHSLDKMELQGTLRLQ